MEMIDVCFAMCVNANIEFYSPRVKRRTSSR